MIADDLQQLVDARAVDLACQFRLRPDREEILQYPKEPKRVVQYLDIQLDVRRVGLDPQRDQVPEIGAEITAEYAAFQQEVQFVRIVLQRIEKRAGQLFSRSFFM